MSETTVVTGMEPVHAFGMPFEWETALGRYRGMEFTDHVAYSRFFVSMWWDEAGRFVPFDVVESSPEMASRVFDAWRFTYTGFVPQTYPVNCPGLTPHLIPHVIAG